MFVLWSTLEIGLENQGAAYRRHNGDAFTPRRWGKGKTLNDKAKRRNSAALSTAWGHQRLRMSLVERRASQPWRIVILARMDHE
jgi:hypothetical protein